MLKRILVLASFLVTVLNAGAQCLSGAYTIGGASPNYLTIASAVSALSSNGVCGPVTFNINPGTYFESVAIPTISGASAVNTITFKAANNDSSSVVIEYSGSPNGYTYNYAMKLSGSYITLQDLTFTQQSSSLSTCLYLSSNFTNKIQSCIFNTGGANNALIHSDCLGGSIYITNCGFNGGATAIDCYGSSARMYVKNCLFSEQTGNTIYGFVREIGRNVINTTSANASSHMIDASSGNDTLMIYGNKITANAGTGLWVSTNAARVFNNYINVQDGTTNSFATSAINWNSNGAVNNFLEVYNNTILFKNNSSNSSVLSLQSYSSVPCRIKNNILINCGKTYLYSTSSSMVLQSDSNCMYSYRNAPGTLFIVNGTNYNSFYSYVATGHDLHSTYKVPVFAGANTYSVAHDVDLFEKGTKVSYITTDIDGNARTGQRSCVGAQEFSLLQTDAYLDKIATYDSVICASDHNLTVRLKNSGADTLHQVDIKCQANSGPLQSYTWNGTLATGDSTFVTVGMYSPDVHSANAITAYISQVNGATDPDPLNDTVKITKRAHLSGQYTIGASGADFPSFNSAVSTMSQNGICGPVDFKIADGMYVEHFTITPVPGVSPVNTITFESQSGDSSLVTLADSNYTLVYLNCPHVTFKKMGFRNKAATYTTMSSIASNISITNCYFRTLGGWSSVLDFSNGSASNITITNNYFIPDAVYSVGNAVDLAVTGMTHVKNIVVNNNTIINHRDAIIILSADSTTISGNKIIYTDTNMLGNSGISVSYSGDEMVISNNEISGRWDRALDIGYAGPSNSAHRIISNNFLSSIGSEVVRLSNSENVELYFNTLCTGSSYGACVLRSYFGSKNNVIKNNIFNSEGYNSLVEEAANVQSIYDHNDYYSKSKDSMFIMINAPLNYLKIGQWQQVTQQDAHSLNYKPQFVSLTDLHISNDINLNGKGVTISGINTDHDGDTRSNLPDMGADEFSASLLTNDAALLNFDPAIIACDSSNTPVRLTLFNNGTDTLNSVTINWVVNGVTQSAYNWSGALAPAAGVFVTLGNLSNSVAMQYSLAAYASQPNGTADLNPQNDSAFATPLKPSLGGTYTIGGHSADFNIISDATSYLKLYGVCAPVIFNLNDGLYSEYVEVDSVKGASSVNTITFQSATNNFNHVRIQGPSSNSPTLMLLGADHITFRNLTFVSNPYGGAVMTYSLGCNYLTFDSVQFLSQSAITGSADPDHYMTFDHCFIYAPVQMWGTPQVLEKGFRFLDCVLNARDGLTVNYSDSVTISGNHFICAGISNNNNGIHVMSSGANFDIIKNYIGGAFGNGMALEHMGGTAARHVLVANNSVAGGSGTARAIICDYSNYVDLFYNSCHVNDSTMSGGPIVLLSNTNLTLRNNVLSNTGGGYAFYIYNGGQFSSSDYNIFYTNGSSQISNNGSVVSLPSYQISSGKETHSSFLDPQFYSATDLHYNNASLNGLAVPVAGITDDIQNKVRSATAPNPGAFETPPDTVYDPVNKDVWVTASTNSLALGSNTISITFENDTVQNYDPYHIYTGTIDSVDVSYKLNNGPWLTQLWTGNLAIQQSATYNFTIPQNIQKGRIYWLTVKAKLHSASTTDNNPSNDSLRTRIIVPMAGTYYVGGANADFSTGDSALYNLNTCHETSAVTFSFRPGFYYFSTVSGYDTLTVISDNGNASSVILDCGQLYAWYLSLKKVSIRTNANGCGGTYTDQGTSTSSNRLLVDSCIVFGANWGYGPANGFWIFGSTDVTITHNSFKNLGIGIVYIDMHNICGISGGWGGRHLIAHNTFDSVQTAIKVEAPSGSINPSDSIHFCYNTVTNTGVGVHITGYGNMLVRVYGNNIHAIHSAIKVYPANYAIPYYNNFLSGGDTLHTGGSNEFTYVSTVALGGQNQQFTNNSVYGSISIDGGSNNVLNNNTVFADTMMALELNGSSTHIGDHNNYFTNGRYLASLYNYYGLPTLDSLRLYTANDQHSISHNPYYYSTTDLHSNSPFLQDAGVYNAIATVDYDGQQRSLPPDIGADEINLVADVVWPGDADASSKADNTDFLSIGLYNGSTGTARVAADNIWTPHISTDWNLTQYDSVDYKHADCNGDGIINDDDTLAISQNYSLVHNTNTRIGQPNEVYTTGNDLYFVMPHPKASYNIGDTIYADIWFGHPSSPVSNAYGVAFSIYTYGPCITPGTFVVKMENSWLGTPYVNAYGFGKTKADVGVAGAVLVRKDHLNASGTGKIGHVSFIYNGNTPSQGINLDFVDVTAVNATGNHLNVTSHNNNANNYTPFNGIGVNEMNWTKEGLNAWPNPFVGSTTITCDIHSEDHVKLELYDATGRLVSVVADEKLAPGTYSYKISASSLGIKSGVYFVKLTLSGGISQIRVICTE